MYEKLFTPCRIGSLTIPNRVAMDPLQNFLAGPDGQCTDRDIAFYKARAKGGIGMITTGTVCVDLENGRANTHVLGIDKDDLIPGFARLADAVHYYGTSIFVQLFHPGRQGLSELNQKEPMMSSSNKPCGLLNQPTREMSTQECYDMIDKFVQGALRCKTAGIDGVTLHAAHGYLLQQFLSPYTNQRIDEFGRNPEGRAKIVCDIIKGIKEKCGKNYPVIVRISADEFLDAIGHEKSEGITLELSCFYAELFEKCGADAIDVSAGNYETMNTAWEPMSFSQGWKAYLAGVIKKAVNIPVICTAAIRDPKFAELLLEKGICDFVGSARTHFADPEWTNKVRRGKEDMIRPCISCLSCFSSLFNATSDTNPNSGKGCYCAMNPQGCREEKFGEIEMDGRGKTVVIVGAGPAGLEAARVLALRRFCPIIIEKSDRIGGQMNLADKPPARGAISKVTEYYENMIENLHIDLRLETEATPELIKVLYPDAVIIATGSTPVLPSDVDGIDKEIVTTPHEVLSGKKILKDMNVLVVGTGLSGLETADYLADMGNTVIVAGRNKDIGHGAYFQNLQDIYTRINQKRIAIFSELELLEVKDDRCIFRNERDEKLISVKADAVVVALGSKPLDVLSNSLGKITKDVFVIGDANAPRGIGGAIYAGFETAFNMKLGF